MMLNSINLSEHEIHVIILSDIQNNQLSRYVADLSKQAGLLPALRYSCIRSGLSNQQLASTYHSIQSFKINTLIYFAQKENDILPLELQ